MRDQVVERKVQAWLAAHYGVISRPEALTVGLTPAQIKSRVKSGRWQIVCRGVYHLGAAPSVTLYRKDDWKGVGKLARYVAAVSACSTAKY